MTDQEPTQTHKIVIETFTDYSEAIAALDEQIEVARLISQNIAEIAEAIEQYELQNDIKQ